MYSLFTSPGKKLLFVYCMIWCGASAKTVSENIFINRGVFFTVDSTAFPYFTYNRTSAFNSKNAVINLTTSDTLLLEIINNDTVTHGFDILNISGSSVIIAPADTVIDTLIFTQEGNFIYYDHYKYPQNRYMGLGGMICVSNSANKKFYWNIKEHQVSYNHSLDTGATVNWSNYDPDYYTINGLSHPDLENDSTSKVRGNVGDTIIIFIANTGQSVHSIHFHGFHCKILSSNAGPEQVGRVKDTFSVKSMQSLMLEMVPDKTGQYTVHDHNLVAVSGGGVHPNGMMVIMEIQ